MLSNERPSPYERQPHFPPKPPIAEDTLERRHVDIERKTFIFTLKENVRGRFLRISEEGGNRRDSLIIPVTGLEDFKKLLEEMVKASNELPTKSM